MRGAVLIAASILATTAVLIASPEFSESEKPNIVYVLLDDSSRNLLWAMPQTKRLVADEGMTFENATYPLAVCCPSRASMLTGLYPHNHGLFYTVGEGEGYEHPRWPELERESIAPLLNGAGYRTAYFGKYMNQYDTTEVPPGYDRFEAMMGSYERSETWRMNDDGEEKTYSRNETLEMDLYAEHFREFVNDGSTPFFSVISPPAPHGPPAYASRHENLYSDLVMKKKPNFNEADVSDKPTYIKSRSSLTRERTSALEALHRDRARSATAVDEMVASVMESLRESGELGNTYLVVWNDNGYSMGAHRLTQKHTAYREDISYPMYVRGPGVAHGSSQALVGAQDIAPTFADLAGLEMSRDGRSFEPLLSDPEAPYRKTMLVESKPTYQREQPFGLPGYEAAVSKDYKYVEWDDGSRELYDLNADPYELTNLLSPTLGVQALSDAPRLREKLAAMRRCEGDGCLEAEGTD